MSPADADSNPHPLRRRVHDVLARTTRRDPLGRWVDAALVALIIANVVAFILETVPWIYARHERWFLEFESLSVVVFSIEYALRLWTCPEEPRHPTRLRYAMTPGALIDLLAVLPFWLALLTSLDVRFLLILRVVRLFKLARYSTALITLLEVLRREARTFGACLAILLVLLVIAASGAYFVERHAQPEDFGSIPDAMWWAVATLTTVGYGDVTPVTALGKLFGACVTVFGIGMAALPAGILASAFADQLAQNRNRMRDEFVRALSDDMIDADERLLLEEKRLELGLSRKEAADLLRGARARREEMKARHRRECPNCGHALE